MRQNTYFNTPPVTLNLLIINAIIYMAINMLPLGEQLVYQFSVYMPASPHFRIYQLFTHMFLHAEFFHLFLNMFALWMFGRIVEYDLGSKRFLIYYLVCGVGAALIQMGVFWIEINALIDSGNMMAAAQAINTPMLGASGAVFGLLLAFGMIRPNAMVMLLIPPIPMKAKYFVIVFGLIELIWGASAGTSGGVAHFAHVGGMIWGFLLLMYWKKRGKVYFYK